MSSSKRFADTADQIRRSEMISTLAEVMIRPDKKDKKVDIEPDLINASNNVRSEVKNDEKLQALIESIKEVGLLQPLTVVARNGRIELLNGHRRLQALKVLKWEKVPVIVKQFADDSYFTLAQLIENANREDLSPIDHAEAIYKIKLESKHSNKRIGEMLGRHEKYINELIAIAKWPDEAKRYAIEKELNVSVLVSISKTRDGKDPKKVLNLLKRKCSDVRKGAVKEPRCDSLIESWITSNVPEKKYTSRFRSIASYYRKLDPAHREMIKSLIAHVDGL